MAVTHGIFSGAALENIANSAIDQFIVTDTIPMEENRKACPKLTILSVAPLLAESIERLHNGESVSYLFDHVPTKLDAVAPSKL